MAKDNLTLRIEPEVKDQAAALFKALGLDLSTATGIFYRQAIRCNGLPFKVALEEPNEVTYAAMEEAEHILKDPNALKFNSVEDLFKELDS